MNFQEKNNKVTFKKLRNSWYFLIFFGIFIIFFAVGVFELAFKMIETSKYKDLAEAKFLELQKNKEKLTRNIADLNSNEGKEKVFRENFGLGKVGEGVVVVVENSKVEKVKEEKKSFFNFFRNMLSY